MASQKIHLNQDQGVINRAHLLYCSSLEAQNCTLIEKNEILELRLLEISTRLSILERSPADSISSFFNSYAFIF